MIPDNFTPLVNTVNCSSKFTLSIIFEIKKNSAAKSSSYIN